MVYRQEDAMSYDNHKVLSWYEPPMSQGCGHFKLGNDDTVRITFDDHGLDIGCKRITAEAMDKLVEKWYDWRKKEHWKVIQ